MNKGGKRAPAPGFKIARPSAEAESRAKADAARLLANDDGRLSIRMPKVVVRAIHVAALKSGKSMKSFVIDACRAAGAEIPEEDGPGHG